MISRPGKICPGLRTVNQRFVVRADFPSRLRDDPRQPNDVLVNPDWRAEEPANIIKHHLPAHSDSAQKSLPYCVMSRRSEEIATSKDSLKAVAHAALPTCQAGIKRCPIIISLFPKWALCLSAPRVTAVEGRRRRGGSKGRRYNDFTCLPELYYTTRVQHPELQHPPFPSHSLLGTLTCCQNWRKFRGFFTGTKLKTTNIDNINTTVGIGVKQSDFCLLSVWVFAFVESIKE